MNISTPSDKTLINDYNKLDIGMIETSVILRNLEMKFGGKTISYNLPGQHR